MKRSIVLVLVLLVGHVVGLGVYTTQRLEETKAVGEYEGRPADTGSETWLLVGSDSREGLTAEEKAQYSTGDSGGARTDTIILVNVPADGAPTLVSLPRDSYVPIPGHNRGKLNAAYAHGGPELLTQTVELATGTRVDHYMEVGFGGIVGVTNAVGGVELCPEAPIQDEKAGLDLQAGCQELDGVTALGYVRTRYQDPRGDLGRIERQQQYIAAVTEKVTSPGVLLNPVAQWRLASATTRAVKVDRANLVDLADLAAAMQALGNGSGVVLTVPVADPDHRVGGESTVKWDDAAAAALFQTLRDGGTPPAPAP